MKLSIGRAVSSICFPAACASFPLGSQQPSVFAQVPTFRSQSSLVLVDVISRDPKTGLPVREFKKHDFRLFNDGKQVPLTTFDTGYDTRPVILWLVVICNEGGKIAGSAEFVGNEQMFRPAFDQLEKLDTVGVAHWCDNGETQLDLLPTEDRDKPISVLAETIKPVPFHTGEDSDAVGEVTFRKMIRTIIQDAHRRNPQPLPVVVFLDGDHTGQPHRALDQVVDDFLETSGIAFGIKDSRAPRAPPFFIGEVAQIEHYIDSPRLPVNWPTTGGNPRVPLSTSTRVVEVPATSRKDLAAYPLAKSWQTVPVVSTCNADFRKRPLV